MMSMTGQSTWACSAIGARQHYALARALQRCSRLHTFYTDAWAGRSGRWLRFGPAPCRALAARFHGDLPPGKVVAFTTAAIRVGLTRLFRGPPRNIEELCAEFVRVGREFSGRVNRRLVSLKPAARPDGFVGYNTGCLETLQLLSDWGVPTAVQQIDPARTEEEIVRVEAEKWPGWQAIPGRIPDSYFDRLAAEWNVASRVIVNSDWSRRARLEQGVPEHKLLIVPLSYDPPEGLLRRPEKVRPTVVLWLGLVILRKGIQYLLQAARQLMAHRLRFIVAGPIGISQKALASAPPNVTFIGRVTRDRITDLYRQANLFVLPTLSDGFAITQLEAMAHGLPVVTTAHCGEVVTDGVDGRIVPAGDATSLAAAIAELDQNPNLLREMSISALATSRKFTLRNTAEHLEAMITQMPVGASCRPVSEEYNRPRYGR